MKPPRLAVVSILFVALLSVRVDSAHAQSSQAVATPDDLRPIARQFFSVYFGWASEESASPLDLAMCLSYMFGNIDRMKPAHDISVRVPQSTNATTPGLRVLTGVTGELGIIFSGNTTTFMGGPQVLFVPRNPRVIVYGEFLVGGLHFSDFGNSGTDFAMMPAAGVMIGIPQTKRIKISAQIGFLQDFFEGFHQTDPRFLFGVELPIGK